MGLFNWSFIASLSLRGSSFFYPEGFFRTAGMKSNFTDGVIV